MHKCCEACLPKHVCTRECESQGMCIITRYSKYKNLHKGNVIKTDEAYWDSEWTLLTRVEDGKKLSNCSCDTHSADCHHVGVFHIQDRPFSIYPTQVALIAEHFAGDGCRMAHREMRCIVLQNKELVVLSNLAHKNVLNF